MWNQFLGFIHTVRFFLIATAIPLIATNGLHRGSMKVFTLCDCDITNCYTSHYEQKQIPVANLTMWTGLSILNLLWDKRGTFVISKVNLYLCTAEKLSLLVGCNPRVCGGRYSSFSNPSLRTHADGEPGRLRIFCWHDNFGTSGSRGLQFGNYEGEICSFIVQHRNPK